MGVSAFWLMLGALGCYAIAYRFYSGFIARRVLELDDRRVTPAHTKNDGQNFHPTGRGVLWGHHFAAISGAGPLIGPVLAAQFGWLPGWLWLVFGVCLGGAVQDFVILVASVRRKGKSLAEIARDEVSPLSGAVAIVAILFIIVVALAVLGFVVVHALAESPWGTFTIAASIPIALLMGLWLYRIRPGKVGEASAAGVALLLLAVVGGAWLSPGQPLASWASFFTLSKDGITTSIAIYGFIASVLPVWMLLCPRDYLSSYMKVGTIALIVGTVLIVQPTIQAPALSAFVTGAGPIIKGPLFPFVFITIACGAISGFHSLVSSGTTPKMLDRETHARPIGYGAMLMESLVGVTALIAACALAPSDYYQINMGPEAFSKLIAKMDLGESHLGELSAMVGEPRLAGRTGGGVSLAAGIAQIFGDIPFLRSAMAFVYHFVIMFEALFVLTTIDTGTRIARFLVQELVARFSPRFGRQDFLPGTILASALVVGAWSFFIYTGSILTLWPMFGIANQLLAVVALCLVTTLLVNTGRGRYALVTLLPMLFVTATTLTAAAQLVSVQFPAMIERGQKWTGILNIGLTVFVVACVGALLLLAVSRWVAVWGGMVPRKDTTV